MIVGHYAASFAAKAIRPKIPLWHLVIAAQLIDFAWAAFILMEIEDGDIIEGYTVEFPFDFFYMPYSHSLPALLFWCAASYLFYLKLVPSATKKDALVIATVVSSHWFLDLIVHPADLGVLPGIKVGFGLWNYPLWSCLLEFGLLTAAIIWYSRAVRAREEITWHLEAFVIVFILSLHFIFYFHWNPTSIFSIALMVFVSYTLLTVLAWWYERYRAPRTTAPGPAV